MKLITETTQDVKFLAEETIAGKRYSIEGVFMQADTKNRNGRIYEARILNKEVERYNTEYVKNNRAMGELGHPEGPSLNLERVSHLITNLRVDGSNVYGTAKILGTPYGKIVENLIDSGVKLGVSSRGMGSLREVNGVQMVQEDFMLAAVDIVADPSAPNAFVNGIMEGKEWIWENGIFKQIDLENAKKIIQKTPTKNLEEQKLNIFKTFLKYM